MRNRPTVLLFLIAWAATEAATIRSVEAQNLLDRLENRVRERLGGQESPQPAPPPELQSPPLQPSEASGRPPALGLEAEERGERPPYEVVVNMVRPGTAADQAGIQPGDTIVSVDGRPVGSIADISSMLRSKRPGDSLRVSIRRNGQQIDTQAVFPLAAETPPDGPPSAAPETDPERRGPAVVERPPAGSGRIGVTVENAATTAPGPGVPVKRGAVVVAVAPGSPADAAGIQPGNVVVAIDGRVVRDAAGLIEEVGATVPGQQIEVSFYRGESLVRIPLRLAGADGLAASATRGAAPGEARLGSPTRPGEFGAGPLGASSAGSTAAGGSAPTGVLGGLGQAIGGIFGGGTPSAAVPAAPSMKVPTDDITTDVAPPHSAPPVAALQAVPSLDPPPTSGPPPISEPLPTAEPLTELDVSPAETVPPPPQGPDEIRQLLDKLQAMQRRIDVLERRLAEIEAEGAGR